MSLTKHRQDWDDLGEVDPYWAVLSAKNKRFGKWGEREFFLTGEREIEEVMERAKRLGRPSGRGAVLDFGCGVGRVTRALAKHFSQCVGVDISSSMIAKARELNSAVENCRFVVNTEERLGLFEDNNFDMIYTAIVLQHLPTRHVIMTYVGEFMRTLKTDGLLVFQLPSHLGLMRRLQPRRRLYALLRTLGFTADYLYRRLNLYPIRMNFIPENEMIEFLTQPGGEVLETQESSAGVSGYRSTIYYVTKSSGGE